MTERTGSVSDGRPKPCQCPLAGYCDTLGRVMPPGFHRLCQESEPHRTLFQSEAERGVYSRRAANESINHRNPKLPGNMLHQVFEDIGIKVTDGCTCKTHIREMNERGREWCRENVDTILGWLEEEATRQGLEFYRLPTELFVRYALWRSE